MNPAAGADCPVSIVVISLLGGTSLGRCLSALRNIDRPVTVVAAEPPPATAGRVVHLPSDAAVPGKRRLGIGSTRSEWIALIEDTCEISETWPAALEEILHRPDLAVVGGPVMIDCRLAPRTMALACLEYGEFAGDRVQGLAQGHGRVKPRPAARLAGLNLLYRRAALPPLANREGLIEVEVNAAIRASGGRIAIHPALSVRYSAQDWASATLRSRYTHGRIYGGGQRLGRSLAARLAAIAKCAAVPLVLFARTARAVPRGYSRRLRAWAWLAAFALAWSAGEAVGFAFGRGDSLDGWR